MGLSIGFVVGFMVDLLFHVVSTLISCLCLYLCFCCFFGCCGFCFFRGEKGSWNFFQRGAKEEEEERLAFWLSHVELECLKLEFQVNFH